MQKRYSQFSSQNYYNNEQTPCVGNKPFINYSNLSSIHNMSLDENTIGYKNINQQNINSLDKDAFADLTNNSCILETPKFDMNDANGILYQRKRLDQMNRQSKLGKYQNQLPQIGGINCQIGRESSSQSRKTSFLHTPQKSTQISKNVSTNSSSSRIISKKTDSIYRLNTNLTSNNSNLQTQENDSHYRIASQEKQIQQYKIINHSNQYNPNYEKEKIYKQNDQTDQSSQVGSKNIFRQSSITNQKEDSIVNSKLQYKHQILSDSQKDQQETKDLKNQITEKSIISDTENEHIINQKKQQIKQQGIPCTDSQDQKIICEEQYIQSGQDQGINLNKQQIQDMEDYQIFMGKTQQKIQTQNLQINHILTDKLQTKQMENQQINSHYSQTSNVKDTLKTKKNNKFIEQQYSQTVKINNLKNQRNLQSLSQNQQQTPVIGMQHSSILKNSIQQHCQMNILKNKTNNCINKVQQTVSINKNGFTSKLNFVQKSLSKQQNSYNNNNSENTYLLNKNQGEKPNANQSNFTEKNNNQFISKQKNNQNVIEQNQNQNYIFPENPQQTYEQVVISDNAADQKIIKIQQVTKQNQQKNQKQKSLQNSSHRQQNYQYELKSNQENNKQEQIHLNKEGNQADYVTFKNFQTIAEQVIDEQIMNESMINESVINQLKHNQQITDEKLNNENVKNEQAISEQIIVEYVENDSQQVEKNLSIKQGLNQNLSKSVLKGQNMSNNNKQAHIDSNEEIKEDSFLNKSVSKCGEDQSRSLIDINKNNNISSSFLNNENSQSICEKQKKKINLSILVSYGESLSKLNEIFIEQEQLFNTPHNLVQNNIFLQNLIEKCHRFLSIVQTDKDLELIPYLFKDEKLRKIIKQSMVFERSIIVFIAQNLLDKEVFTANYKYLKGIVSYAYQNYINTISIIHHKMNNYFNLNTLNTEEQNLTQPNNDMYLKNNNQIQEENSQVIINNNSEIEIEVQIKQQFLKMVKIPFGSNTPKIQKQKWIVNQLNQIRQNNEISINSFKIISKNDKDFYAYIIDFLKSKERYQSLNQIFISLLQYFSLYLAEKQQQSDSKIFSLIPFLQTSPAPYLPDIDNKYKYTLVLDLDETLIHYTEIQGTVKQFAIRPYLQNFLHQISEFYEIVIFTAGMPDYANWVIDNFDTKGYIKYRLYRQHTIQFQNSFIKDLSRIGRDLSKVIIIDNLAENFQFQPDNGIFIREWLEDPSDTALAELLPLLKEIAIKQSSDVRVALRALKDQIQKNIENGVEYPHLNLKL